MIPRRIVRRLPLTIPDVEQERRVQRLLYGTRTQVSLIDSRQESAPRMGHGLDRLPQRRADGVSEPEGRTPADSRKEKR